DLHKDGQLMVTGRYRKPGTARVILTGSRHDSRERFSNSFVFPEEERKRDFVARLWATRRVGQLLEQVRLNGENEELKDEIVSLAKEFRSEERRVGKECGARWRADRTREKQ